MRSQKSQQPVGVVQVFLAQANQSDIRVLGFVGGVVHQVRCRAKGRRGKKVASLPNLITDRARLV